jgi:hypothetical protein
MRRAVPETSNFCTRCGSKKSSSVVAPSQAHPATGRKRSALGGIVSLISAIAIAWYFFGGGLESQADHDLQHIEAKVATDAVKEYRMAVSSGDRTDICVHAGLVAAAYQQAHDEEDYLEWKKQEKSDCAYINIP